MYSPAWQASQAVLAPAVAVNLPGGQAVQLVSVLSPSAVYTFMAAVNWPAGHLAHEFGLVAISQNLPAAQPLWQELQLGLPISPSVLVPAGHAKHPDWPTAG